MIVVIGEALIDLIGRGGNQYEVVVGGANANVALALAARGERQVFLGRISKDGFGQLIRRRLTLTGVNLDYAVTADEQTSLAVANIDEAGLATYSFYLNGTADWHWRESELPALEKLESLGVTAVQYGCLGMAIGPGNEVIEDWLTRIKSGSSITLSHDLNIRPAIGLEVHRERARVERLNQISDIIKASDADLEWLYATKIPAELDAVANGWSIEKLVIVSRGEHGVKAFKNGKVFDIPAFKTSLVDTVGAGDTFMASFLAELNQLGHLGKKTSVSEISDEDLVRAMRTASAAASIVCGRTGCLPPTRDEIQQKLANAD